MTLYDKYDRSVYERIRLKLVALGYLPDITAYATITLYDAAKETLKLTLPYKKVTEVFGIGMWRAKSCIEPNMIIISRKSETKGSLGGFPEVGFVKKLDGNFDKVQYPRHTKNLMYDIRVITSDIYWERVLTTLIEEVLGTEDYLPMVDPTTGAPLAEAYMMLQTANLDMSSVEFLERMYKYTLKDVFVTEAKIIRANIPPLTRIDFGLIVEPHIPGSFESQRVDITVLPPPVP